MAFEITKVQGYFSDITTVLLVTHGTCPLLLFFDMFLTDSSILPDGGWGWGGGLVPLSSLASLGPVRRPAGSSGKDWACEDQLARMAEPSSVHSMWLVRHKSHVTKKWHL